MDSLQAFRAGSPDNPANFPVIKSLSSRLEKA
jgi:hypothetical protein